MSTRQDLTKYSENELQLMVFNTEALYKTRHLTGFIDRLGKMYRYTDRQLEVLTEALASDLEEIDEHN